MPSEAITVIDRHSRDRLRRYLEPWPRWPFVMIAWGTLLGLAMLKVGPQPMLRTGWLGFTALGAAAIWLWYALRVSEREFDLIANADYEAAATLALRRQQLEPSDLRFPGHCKWRTPNVSRDIGKAFRGQKRGWDEKTRRSPHEFTVVNFGLDHLFVFRCAVDLTTGSTLYEESREILYRDVLSVDIDVEIETIRLNYSFRHRRVVAIWEKRGVFPIHDALQLPGKHTLRLRVAGGEAIELATFRGQTYGLPSGEGAKALAAAQRLRKLLRVSQQTSQVARAAGDGRRRARDL